AETAWLGTPGLQPKARFPIIALDGCAEGCTRRWLAQRGITPDRHYVLDSADARRGFEAIAAELA
ncbi:MAG TPA: putative zinc-binding protein, partial [Burkholderiales bacterium]|nr:putative zinc-binding protein [Burkholderiales bacterium]